MFKPERFSGGISFSYQGLKKDFFSFRKMVNASPNFENSSCKFYTEVIDKSLKFESCRSSLFFLLSHLREDEAGTKVVCCAYTCSAVLEAIIASGFEPTPVDLNRETLQMCEEQILLHINDGCEIVIVQNSFGLPGVSLEFLHRLKALGVIAVIDNALSFGSKPCIPLLEEAPFHVFSFEVSKAFTVGWAGGLVVNEKIHKRVLQDKVSKLNKVGVFEDLRRFIQLFLSFHLQNHGSKPLTILWFLLRGIGFFRTSGPNYLTKKAQARQPGLITKHLICRLKNLFSTGYHESAEKNTEFAIARAQSYGLKIPAAYVEAENNKVVTPRLPVFLNSKIKRQAIANLNDLNFSNSVWFDEIATEVFRNTEIHNISVAVNMAEGAVNVPCYINLTEETIDESLRAINKQNV